MFSVYFTFVARGSHGWCAALARCARRGRPRTYPLQPANDQTWSSREGPIHTYLKFSLCSLVSCIPEMRTVWRIDKKGPPMQFVFLVLLSYLNAYYSSGAGKEKN